MSFITIVKILYQFTPLQYIDQLHAATNSKDWQFVQLGIAVDLFFKEITFNLEGRRTVVIYSFPVIKRRVCIYSAGENKAVTLINIFRIIFFKIEFNKLDIIFQIT